MKLQLQDAAQAMGTTTALTGEVSSWSIDSRTLQPGDVFFALEGEVHDGHRFVSEVLERGPPRPLSIRTTLLQMRE